MLGIGPDGPVGGEPAMRHPDDPEREAERAAWVALASVEGLGPVGLGSLHRRFGDGRSILAAAATAIGRARIAAHDGAGRPIDPAVADRIAEAAEAGEALMKRVRELDLSVVTLEDAAYPVRLLELELPPHLLFVRGDPAALSRPHAVAVVGTRRATEAREPPELRD